MKAAILKDIENLEVSEIATPEPKAGEILVLVKACAICGTDLKVFHHGHKHISFPRVTGHEISGIIKSVGEKVSGYKQGDRVAIAPAIPCGKCYYCRRGWQAMCDNLKAIGYHYDGGFAEYMIVPEDAVNNGCVNMIPDNLMFEQAAIAEPLACVINGQMLSHVAIGDTVVILGAGPIGCFHAQLAFYLGAEKVILGDIDSKRLISAEFTGAELIDMSRKNITKEIAEITNGRMADRVIVAAGSAKAQELSLELVAKRGSVNFFGGLPKETPFIQFNSNFLHYGEFFVTGTHGSAPHHNKMALGILSSGKINAENYITDVFSLDQIKKGLAKAESKEGLKIIITP